MIEIANLLQTYGGWGISALCIMSIWRMGKYITQLHSDQQKEAKATAEAQREETRAIVTALVETRDALRSFKEAMQALANKLED